MACFNKLVAISARQKKGKLCFINLAEIKIDNDSHFCSYCGTKQSETNKPTLVNNDALVQEEAKTVNVNLSFDRQTNSKPNQETNKTLIRKDYQESFLNETQ